jgi:hypothetical protein
MLSLIFRRISRAVPRWAAATASLVVIGAVSAPPPAIAQTPSAPLPAPVIPYARPEQPPVFAPAELDRIVSPIALYPDPLLANVLTAATFPDGIPEAARWADDHHHLTGARLTAAIAADEVPWDPSVQALLPFPSVLAMMASDMPWTEELGDAVLSDRAAVMNAVQRMRRLARDYGYLRSCAPVVVTAGPYVEILPVNPTYIVVPYYFPRVVFGPPVPGAVYGGVYCGYGVTLGVWFQPWGWGTTRIIWPNGTIVIDGAPWDRTWINRGVYRHPYRSPRFATPQPPDRHRARPSTPRERERERPKGAPQLPPPSQNRPPDSNPPASRRPPDQPSPGAQPPTATPQNPPRTRPPQGEGAGTAAPKAGGSEQPQQQPERKRRQ